MSNALKKRNAKRRRKVEITKGKAQMYAETIMWLFISAILIITAYGWIRNYPGYDDTDDVVNKVRSGMVLYTDYNTGCQYLSTRSLFTVGTLIPRVDSAGKHMC